MYIYTIIYANVRLIQYTWKRWDIRTTSQDAPIYYTKV